LISNVALSLATSAATQFPRFKMPCESGWVEIFPLQLLLLTLGRGCEKFSRLEKKL